MLVLLIIGLFCLLMAYPMFKLLDRRGSRWSNMVLAIMILIGIVCVGLFAGL